MPRPHAELTILPWAAGPKRRVPSPSNAISPSAGSGDVSLRVVHRLRTRKAPTCGGRSRRVEHKQGALHPRDAPGARFPVSTCRAGDSAE